MIDLGQQIGGYKLLRVIGRGALGEVYGAENVSSGERVAIKVLERELSEKTKVLERFFTEARTTSRLGHPGVAATLDYFVHDGQAFVVMELLDGETLGAYLARVGRLDRDVPFLLGVAAATAAAIGAVHGARVIHRDLKPGNIFLHLAASGAWGEVTVKVLDFGIARLSQEEDGPSQTTSGLLLGTPPYMSPEQCRGLTVDARSDVYAFGCILYEAVCGQPPFGAEAGLGDLIVAHVSQAPQPLTKRVPGLSPALSALILRLLAKKPEDRPQTMGDVARALRDCGRAMHIEYEGQPLVPQVPVLGARSGAVVGAGSGVALAGAPAVGAAGAPAVGAVVAPTVGAAVAPITGPATASPVAPAAWIPSPSRESAEPTALPPDAGTLRAAASQAKAQAEKRATTLPMPDPSEWPDSADSEPPPVMPTAPAKAAATAIPKVFSLESLASGAVDVQRQAKSPPHRNAKASPSPSPKGSSDLDPIRGNAGGTMVLDQGAVGGIQGCACRCSGGSVTVARQRKGDRGSSPPAPSRAGGRPGQ